MTTYSGDFCARLRESLPLHALGVPLGEEAAALRDHLEGCAVCRRELDEHREALGLLPLSLSPLLPPTRIRQALLEQIETGQPTTPLPAPAPARPRPSATTPAAPRVDPALAPAPRRGPWLPLLLVASICAAGGLGFLLSQEHRRRTGSEQQLALTEAQLRDSTALLRSQEQRLLESERRLRFLNARNMQFVALTPPSEAQAGAAGRILWDQERRAWLFLAFRLPPPPPDKEYQLWFLLKGEGGPRPVSAGLASQLPTGDLELSITLPADLGEGDASIQAVALTLEQKGGVEKPTTDPVLYGKI